MTDLYARTSYELSKRLTIRYSTSFSMSSRLFDRRIRPHIYAVYGLVRIADEIVDTYRGEDQLAQLDALEAETYSAIERHYSSNPIVHAFALTAGEYGIDRSLIAPFFDSMRLDIGNQYTTDDYAPYIYGSAEVVGLMCLKVFCEGDEQQYEALRPGAQSLGAAYQKVNFLRDIAADYHELGRVYFPGVSFDRFSDADKKAIEDDIRQDFTVARHAVRTLPKNSRTAVAISYTYYTKLLTEIVKTPANVLVTRRVRIGAPIKLWLMFTTIVRGGRI